MFACPKGCRSLEPDFCSECGAKLEPASPPEPCAACETVSRVGARFCERCGHELSKPVLKSDPPSRGADSRNTVQRPGVHLEAVVLVDAQSGEPLPADRTPVIALDKSEVLIGRTSVVKDVRPEIALDDDPGVSRRHAKLVRQDDGSYLLADLGSSNGTILNGVVLVAGSRTPVKAGDEIKLGRWTAIAVRDASEAGIP